MNYWPGALFAAIMAVFVYASLRSSPYLAELPFMPAWIGRWVDAHPNTRHMLGFLVAASLGALALCVGRSSKRWLYFSLGMLASATLLETAQIFMPNRHADWRDLAWSGLGILLGLGVACILPPAARRKTG